MALPTLADLTAIMPVDQAEMVFDVINAANVKEQVDFLKGYEPGEGGFMFSHPPVELKMIYNAMTYQGHSGASHGWTMRVVQTILRHGLELYANEISGAPDNELHLRYLRESLPFKLKEAEQAVLHARMRQYNAETAGADNDTMDRHAQRLSEAHDAVNDLRSRMATLA